MKLKQFHRAYCKLFNREREVVREERGHRALAPEGMYLRFNVGNIIGRGCPGK